MSGFLKKVIRRKRSPTWREFEKYVSETSPFRGYLIRIQKPFPRTNIRPDIYGVRKTNPNDRLVGECKFVKTLTPEHLRQIVKYKRILKARKAILFIPQHTKITPTAKQLIKKYSIKVKRVSFGKKSDLIELFLSTSFPTEIDLSKKMSLNQKISIIIFQ